MLFLRVREEMAERLKKRERSQLDGANIFLK